MEAEVQTAEVPAEIPAWRQELSRRLQEIKSKRESSAAAASEMPAAQPGEGEPVRSPAARRPKRVAAFQNHEKLRKEQDEPSPLPLKALPPTPAPMPIPVTVSTDAMSQREDDRNDQKIKDMIDAAVKRPEPRDSVEANPVPAPSQVSTEPLRPEAQRKLDFNQAQNVRPERKPAPVPMPQFEPGWTPSESGEDAGEERLLLLTRTLAGLVDLIIVALCASCMVFAVDIVEGIDTLDSVSKFHYVLLFLATYFLYSFFFLGMATQTIGMMITDLRVVSGSVSRASVSQIVVRCLMFLLGSAACGLGLAWGFFDRQARCLHDRVSRTRVTRIQ
jgi:uncharacterized RDD family membrane protein YckC